MLKNVKSFYFLRIIFSFIEEIQKLVLIQFNKHEILNISLINYKLLSGRNNVYELNGKGKEYNFGGNLLFEGVYLNGKRNR